MISKVQFDVRVWWTGTFFHILYLFYLETMSFDIRGVTLHNPFQTRNLDIISPLFSNNNSFTAMNPSPEILKKMQHLVTLFIFKKNSIWIKFVISINSIWHTFSPNNHIANGNHRHVSLSKPSLCKINHDWRRNMSNFCHFYLQNDISCCTVHASCFNKHTAKHPCNENTQKSPSSDNKLD